MKAFCWGARGSTPVSGPEYIRYGGDTACLEIRPAAGGLIIVDAGTGIRKLGMKLLREHRERLDLLFTHAHWDHLMGIPFFGPIYRPGVRIDVRGFGYCRKSVAEMVSLILAPPLFPIAFHELPADVHFNEMREPVAQIGSVTVRSIPLSHPNGGLGYRFEENGRSLVFLTDNDPDYAHPGGRNFEDYVRFARGADLLIHDAEYTPAEYDSHHTWGHSTFIRAAELAMAAGVKRLGLFHHNQQRSDDGIDRIVNACSDFLASQDGGLECFAVRQQSELPLG